MQDWPDDIRDNEPKGVITYLVVIAVIIGTVYIVRTSKGKRLSGKSNCESAPKSDIYSNNACSYRYRQGLGSSTKSRTKSYSSGTTKKISINGKLDTFANKYKPGINSIQHDRGCNRLHDYLDYNWIIMTGIDGKTYEGRPIDVCYADETISGEDELDIQTANGIFTGLSEGKIKSIRIIR